jgi:hypothetical protein
MGGALMGQRMIGGAGAERKRAVAGYLIARRRGVGGFSRSMKHSHRCLQRRVDDIGFHYDVSRPADHHQVLDIVAAHENEPPSPSDARVIDHCEPRLRPARRAGEAAHRPYSSADQSEHSDEGEEELDWNRHISKERHGFPSAGRRQSFGCFLFPAMRLPLTSLGHEFWRNAGVWTVAAPSGALFQSLGFRAQLGVGLFHRGDAARQ